MTCKINGTKNTIQINPWDFYVIFWRVRLLSIYLFIHLYICPSIHIFTHHPTHPSIRPSINPSTNQSIVIISSVFQCFGLTVSTSKSNLHADVFWNHKGTHTHTHTHTHTQFVLPYYNIRKQTKKIICVFLCVHTYIHTYIHTLAFFFWIEHKPLVILNVHLFWQIGANRKSSHCTLSQPQYLWKRPLDIDCYQTS